MDQATYNRLYRQARDNFQILTAQTMRQLNKIYIEASDNVARAIREAIKTGKSSITIDSWNAINKQLQEGADRISKAVELGISGSVTYGYGMYANIDKKYVLDSAKLAGATQITATGMDNIAVAVNNQLLTSLVNRVYADDYTYSDRIWGEFKEGATGQIPIGINGDYQYRIKNTVSAGLAQGRDVLKIAKDVQVYTKDGKIALMKRYGALVRGTREFTQRISDKVDWRSLRLVRSELYASLQQASVLQGEMNPATTGMFNWVLTPFAAHSCICPDLAAASPYKANEVPSYPHSNCLCSVVPILEDSRTFNARMRKFANGEYDEKMTTWYNNSYLRYNR